MKKVLFTGGGGAGYEAFYRLLKKKYDLYFCDANPEFINPIIPINKKYKIPFANNHNFDSQVENLYKKLNIDLLIPGVDEELIKLSKMSKRKELNTLLPDLEFIKLHLNKLDSNNFLIKNNLPAPKVIRADKGGLEFPCIVKPINGRGSRNVFLANNEEEVKAQITLSRKKSNEFILQEYIDGQEFTVNISSDINGKLKAIVPVLVNVKKGITISADMSKDNKVIEGCERIHRANRTPGCYNIQLIKDVKDNIIPFEINPRVSTTSCLSIAAGVDFINNYLSKEMNCKEFDPKTLTYNPKVSLRRFWYNNITN
tara:strand:- start:562 stop:1500 length:939 start_codon:yes stop_codon:yes gene_type:complete